MAHRPSARRCYLCGAAGPTTRDHVIPRNLFPSPAPPDLITAPACRACNESLSKDEEYFRVFILGQAAMDHSDAKEIWRTSVRRSLARRPAFKAMLASRIRSVPIRTPAGQYLGDAPAMSAPEDRINPVLWKIVKGLYYHRRGDLLEGVGFSAWCNPSDVQSELWKTLPHADVGGEAFSYWHAIAEDDPRQTIWWLAFYRRVLFIVISEPRA